MTKTTAGKAAADTNTPEVVSSAPTFGFDKFVVRRLVFEEQEKKALTEGEPSPQSTDLNLEIAFVVGLSDEGRRAEVQMNVVVTTDPRVKPYRIELIVVGYFHVKQGTREDLLKFAQQLAPAILFPYIRETVDRTTADGRYGSVRLDPLNVLAAIDPNAWTPTPPKR